MNLFVTSACTCKCIMCGVWGQGANYISDETFDETVEVLESLGFYNFSLTGGEPLLHPKYFDYMKSLDRKGLYTNSPTNGTLLTEKNVSKLREANVDSIFVSVDSLKAKTAGFIRHHPDQLHKALNGLKLLKKYQIPKAAIIVLSNYNIDDYVDMIVELDEEYDAPSILCFPDWGVGPLDKILGNQRSPNDTLIPVFERSRLVRLIDELLDLKKRGYRLFNATEYLLDVRRTYLGEPRHISCYGGYYVLNVDWNGYVTACFNKKTPLCHISRLSQDRLVKNPCFRCLNQCFVELSLVAENMAKKRFWTVLDDWSTIFKALH